MRHVPRLTRQFRSEHVMIFLVGAVASSLQVAAPTVFDYSAAMPDSITSATTAPIGGASATVSLADDARRLCQALLRMDTTNPPGNEHVCAEYLAANLAEVGYKPE